MTKAGAAAPAMRLATPAAVSALLDIRRGALLAPVRSEIFGRERFAEHGRSLGVTHRAARGTWRSAAFFPRLGPNIRVLREAHAFIGTQAAAGHDISPAAEWLLDNYHLIEAQIVEIHEGMPRSYFRALPVLQDEPLAGLPRVYGAAWAFVAHTDGAFDESLLACFLDAYQQTRELGLGELWALPTTLRVVLVENLRRLAEREAAHQAARAFANEVCDRIEEVTPALLDDWLMRLELRGVAPAFLTQVAQRLNDRAAAPHEHLNAWLAQALPDAPGSLAQQNADQTADNLSVSNAVGSLRAIGDADWNDIVAVSSPLIAVMLGSPVFAGEHAGTRDQSLHAIEKLSRRSGRSELAVARTLLGLIEPGTDASASTPGHWLQGRGRGALMRALGVAPWRIDLMLRPWRRAALPAYLGALGLGTAALVAWLLFRQGLEHSSLALLGSALLVALPASEAVAALLHRLASESVRPQALPRLGLNQGLGPEHRVMVVVPAMLTSDAGIAGLVHRLRLHHLANPERETQFALLSDWADAPKASTDTDAALLASARGAVAQLNALHPPAAGAAPRFLVLHRERRFSESEQRWIGWERKRGKLEELVRRLATGEGQPFIDLGDESRIAEDTHFVVTLDSDTVLPPGRLRDLLGVATHPLNRPQLDPARRRVVGGYGILQPRVQTPLPANGRSTPFHWLFAGQRGLDPYSGASSEVYQDLFGEGSFAGKGLLDVAAMHAVLDRRLPESRVLSHDLLEGAFARCASVSELALIEDAPYEPEVAAARVHRWTRGDWQLLPFLMHPRRWPLGTLNRWKIADNLRRSLVAPASLLLLVLALAGHVMAPWNALALVLAALAAGPVIGALAGFVPRRGDLALRHFCQQAAMELARASVAGLWQIVQLLEQALQAVDAVARALHRMAVSRRLLLQWTPSSAPPSAPTLREVLARHRTTSLAALLLLTALLALHGPAPGLALLLTLAWAAAPLALWWAGRPVAPDGPALGARERAHLRGVARDTWRFFERTVGAQDHHLPPDNLQNTPHEMLAHRTSPTNIGLYLLSVACAERFGFIDGGQMVSRLEDTLATLRRMERHRGHFLNWYDTETLAPLLPMYVSTVDSGNLGGHLLALAQACLARAADPAAAPLASRLLTLARDFEALAWEPDYSFLYHRRRHLLHIGWRVAEQQLDASFYDLLASESRLTSLLAIAKGDVPVRHWSALGRPFYAVGATAGLRSWSGSMFEYLMPSLVLDEPEGSGLRGACHAAVQEQIDFAAARGVPWGISESAYAASDHTLAYQYAPQGVPRLALRRTPPDELVVAPYASALATLVAPRRASANLAHLEALGARSPLGYIEALDYTPARQAGTGAFTRVDTCMAHHQGMTLVALANVLLGGIVQRWGMADPHLEAMGSLLHERAPRAVSASREPLAAAPRSIRERRPPGLLRELQPGQAAVEPTQLLSNGRYNVALRANGAGHSRWGTCGVTRWRDDALRDDCGSFLYLRLDAQAQPVSITSHPAPDPEAGYHAVFHADRVCFDAAWPTLRAHATVWVSPEDDIEFRQVELSNSGAEAIEIELISAFEPTLAEARAEESHPAFANLFLRAGWQAAQQALVFERTPRLAGEPRRYGAHFVAGSEAQITGLRVQTDRQRWRGRNRATGQPLAQFDTLPAAREGTFELVTGLDPVCALAVRLHLAAGAKAQVTFATAAGDDRGTLHAVIDKYHQPSHVERASLMSATLAGVRARTLRLAAEDFAAVQSLSTALLLSLARPQPMPPRPADELAPVCDRRLLWRFGISGERPLIGVSAGSLQGLGLLRTLAQALRLWNWSALACDIVVVNAEPPSYQMSLQRELAALSQSQAPEGPFGFESAKLHVLRAEDLSLEETGTLRRLARLWLQADGRPLPHHVQAWTTLHEQARALRRTRSTEALVPVPVRPVEAAAPRGRFAPEDGAFAFDVGAALRPPRPWINVLANPGFGTQVSEAGGGYSWARNSRLHQLTPWSNDPVADPGGETFLLQDLRGGAPWSVSPSAHAAAVVYRVEHRQGSTRIAHRRGDLEVWAEWCVDASASVKQMRLTIANGGEARQRLRVVGIVEWVLGAQRADRNTLRTAAVVPNAALPGASALLATQLEHAEGFGGGTAFLALAGRHSADWTCDRRECFDEAGRPVLPQRLGRHAGSGLDPCAALACEISIAPGARTECVFLLGWAEDADAARALAAHASAVDPAQRQAEAERGWEALLSATTVKTPDPLFDVMVNRWLLYQAVACRLWAKAGFYQAGGATGFRDQLQDTMALAWAAPEMLRTQILACAGRQFPEGDVQHWWHMPGGAGVRTHFSDDLLWLPYACAHYLRTSDDAALLDETLPFLQGGAVPEGAEDLYEVPTLGSETASVYEHAARTIDRSLKAGVHGLPLMGTGDWNDGMNRVGHGGRGESVWLGWFLCRVVADFAPLARARGDADRARRWEQAAAGWAQALATDGWDGQWYRRAFFDDGQALGSAANAEARIDLVAQAWSVLSGAASPTRQRQAMAAVEEHLADGQAGLLRLLDPPLAQAAPSAGYIQAYPAGVRENGGQYSHAAVWALMAEAELARQDGRGGDTALRHFAWLSPAHRAADPVHGPRYGLEPYVMAGDVYSQPPYTGRGGWSWYTGSASWMHRAAVESIFGLRIGAEALCFEPCLPAAWALAEITLRRAGHTMHFALQREAAELPAGWRLLRPGESLAWRALPLETWFAVPLAGAVREMGSSTHGQREFTWPDSPAEANP